MGAHQRMHHAVPFPEIPGLRLGFVEPELAGLVIDVLEEDLATVIAFFSASGRLS